MREVEKIVKTILNPDSDKEKKDELPQNIRFIYEEIENKLKERLSRKVEISSKGKNGSGKIQIEFYSNDDLERLIELLSNLNI